MKLRIQKDAIDTSMPISEFMICRWPLLQSAAGPCNVGSVVLRTDPRVALAPEAFGPLVDALDVPRGGSR